MNLVDLTAVIVFIGVFAGAFFAGFGRTVAGLLALGVGLLAASVAYSPLGSQLAGMLAPISRQIADLLAFILLLAIGGIGLFVVVLRSFAVSRLRTRLTYEMRGGLVSNVILCIAAGVLAASMVVVVIQISDRTVTDLPAGGTVVMLRREYGSSVIAGQALRMSPYLYHAVAGVLPGGAPEILVPAPH